MWGLQSRRLLGPSEVVSKPHQLHPQSEDVVIAADPHDFFGGESDTESLGDPQHDEEDPPMQAIPVDPVRRMNAAFVQFDIIILTEEFERLPRIMRTVLT